MLQTKEHNSHAIVCEAPGVITEREIIATLRGMVEHRFHGVSLYPGSKYFSETIEVIKGIRENLDRAEQHPNCKEAAKICLRTELSFHYIAPRTTRKIFCTYMTKLNFLMDACRLILNYKKQAA